MISSVYLGNRQRRPHLPPSDPLFLSRVLDGEHNNGIHIHCLSGAERRMKANLQRSLRSTCSHLYVALYKSRITNIKILDTCITIHNNNHDDQRRRSSPKKKPQAARRRQQQRPEEAARGRRRRRGGEEEKPARGRRRWRTTPRPRRRRRQEEDTDRGGGETVRQGARIRDETRG